MENHFMSHLMAPEITDKMTAAAIKANIVLNWIDGMLNPANAVLSVVKAITVIFGIKIVSKYKIIALVIVENNPNVITLNGNVRTLNTGLSIMNINVKAIPPRIYVCVPTTIFTPVTTNGRRKRETP